MRCRHNVLSVASSLVVFRLVRPLILLLFSVTLLYSLIPCSLMPSRTRREREVTNIAEFAPHIFEGRLLNSYVYILYSEYNIL